MKYSPGLEIMTYSNKNSVFSCQSHKSRLHYRSLASVNESSLVKYPKPCHPYMSPNLLSDSFMKNLFHYTDSTGIKSVNMMADIKKDTYLIIVLLHPIFSLISIQNRNKQELIQLRKAAYERSKYRLNYSNDLKIEDRT